MAAAAADCLISTFWGIFFMWVPRGSRIFGGFFYVGATWAVRLGWGGGEARGIKKIRSATHPNPLP